MSNDWNVLIPYLFCTFSSLECTTGYDIIGEKFLSPCMQVNYFVCFFIIPEEFVHTSFSRNMPFCHTSHDSCMVLDKNGDRRESSVWLSLNKLCFIDIPRYVCHSRRQNQQYRDKSRIAWSSTLAHLMMMPCDSHLWRFTNAPSIACISYRSLAQLCTGILWKMYHKQHGHLSGYIYAV